MEDIILRLVKPFEKSMEAPPMAVFHVHFNPCNAMGANLVNQICEFLKNPIEKISGRGSHHVYCFKPGRQQTHRSQGDFKQYFFRDG